MMPIQRKTGNTEYDRKRPVSLHTNQKPKNQTRLSGIVPPCSLRASVLPPQKARKLLAKRLLRGCVSEAQFSCFLGPVRSTLALRCARWPGWSQVGTEEQVFASGGVEQRNWGRKKKREKVMCVPCQAVSTTPLHAFL